MKTNVRWVMSAGLLLLALGAGGLSAPAPPAKEPQVVATLSRHDLDVRSLAFSPDGKQLVSGGQDGTVRLWDVSSGRRIATWEHYPRQRDSHPDIRAVAFSPDGKTVASGGDDKTIKLRNVASGENLATLRGHEKHLLSLTFRPDGKEIASVGGDMTIRFWDLKAKKERNKLRPGDGLASSGRPGVWYGAKNTPLIAAPRRIWMPGNVTYPFTISEEKTEKPVIDCTGHTSPIYFFAFSRDRKTVVSADGDETVRVWNLQTGENTATIERPQRSVISDLALSEDGKFLAFSHGWVPGGSRPHLYLCEVSTGKILAKMEDSAAGSHVALSPDGHLMATASGSDIKIWKLPDHWRKRK